MGEYLENTLNDTQRISGRKNLEVFILPSRRCPFFHNYSTSTTTTTTTSHLALVAAAATATTAARHSFFQHVLQKVFVAGVRSTTPAMIVDSEPRFLSTSGPRAKRRLSMSVAANPRDDPKDVDEMMRCTIWMKAKNLWRRWHDGRDLRCKSLSDP